MSRRTLLTLGERLARCPYFLKREIESTKARSSASCPLRAIARACRRAARTNAGDRVSGTHSRTRRNSCARSRVCHTETFAVDALRLVTGRSLLHRSSTPKGPLSAAPICRTTTSAHQYLDVPMPSGLRKGLTSYGDPGFSLFL